MFCSFFMISKLRTGSRQRAPQEALSRLCFLHVCNLDFFHAAIKGLGLPGGKMVAMGSFRDTLMKLA